MKIIDAYSVIEENIDGKAVLARLGRAGRTAYKSVAGSESGNAEKFVRRLIKRGHLSVIEHESVTVRIVCDRGVSHEIVRHRIASYTQESTRFCNYAGNRFGGEITVIRPSFWDAKKTHKTAYRIWLGAMKQAEIAYIALVKAGARPEEARGVLPNSLKTELVVTMNLREWRHFLTLRTAAAAHPQMREIATGILREFVRAIPAIFDDIGPSIKNQRVTKH